jgi:hypothetical protein
MDSLYLRIYDNIDHMSNAKGNPKLLPEASYYSAIHYLKLFETSFFLTNGLEKLNIASFKIRQKKGC